MNRKIYKVFSPINIILMISLLANIIVIPRMHLYESHISEEISSSVNNMLTSLSESQEVVEQILNSKRIDERQYKSMYFDYEDFEDEFKNLVNYASEFQSESNDFSNTGLVVDICEQLYQFGEENKLSLHKKRGDEIITIDLTSSEIEMFESINQESVFILDAFFEDDDIKEYSVRSTDWVRIIEGIYEYAVNASY